jgi:tetratricopeptide (TPR) repeat protein
VKGSSRAARSSPTRARTPGAAMGGAREPAEPPGDELRWRQITGALLAGYGAALVCLVFLAHRTPTYGVETDLLGVYIPAARALRSGRLIAEHFQFHGVGYPGMLALLGGLLHGDDWLAARVLNVAAALASAWLTFELAARLWSPRTGCFTMAALLATPVFVWSGVEAGTDVPTLALSLAATLLVVHGTRARTLAAAGLLAGVAIVTRDNALFLPVASLPVLLLRRETRRASVAYAIGVAVPVLTWFVIQRRIPGASASNQNYANIAYEFFGRSVPWERFWTMTRGQFHSLGDVIGYDPGRFSGHLATNLATRWWRDAHELMSPWLGFLAAPGLALMLRGRPHARAIALHVALAYAVLAFAFYAPRFFLYLLPFYLGGAVALVLELNWPLRGKRGAAPAAFAARAGVIGLAVLASAVTAVRGTRELLRSEPSETRHAGEWLHAQGLTGRIFARKPHVAYFAGMEYAPLPSAGGPRELLREARARQVEFLLISPIERALRPELVALQDGTVPGFELLHRETADAKHAFSILRMTDAMASDAALDSALIAASRRMAAAPGSPAATQLVLAGNLIEHGRAREALDALEIAERVEPRNAMVARWQTLAYLALQDYTHAASACERAIALGSDTAWERGRLGIARLMLARYPEARDLLREAVAREPANFEFVDNLGIAEYYTGELASSLRTFQRALVLRPGDEEALYYAARLLTRLGRKADAVELLKRARASEAFTSPQLSGLADSLGVNAAR